MIPRSYPLQAYEQYPQIAEIVSVGYHAFSFLACSTLQFRSGSSLMSCNIGKPLAFYPAQKNFRALRVFDSESLAIAVSEIELGEIAIQMVSGAMLVHAFHAALEDRKESFYGIGMDSAIFPSHVFLVHVPSKAVIREVRPYLLVVGSIVSHDAGRAINIRRQQRHNGFHLDVVDERQNLVHALVAALGFVFSLVLAEEGFVHFHDAALPAERLDAAILHRLTDAMGHEPSGLQGNPQSAVQLVRADPLLARCDEEDRLQPKMQRDMTRLEDGPDLDGEGLAAVVALVNAYPGALAAHLAIAFHATAMWAYRAARPYASLDKGVSFFFFVKVGGI